MISRILPTHIEDLLKTRPVVSLTGPRDMGKTTLAQVLSDIYFNIETPVDIDRLDMDWVRVMKLKELIVLDEAHVHPELFLRIRASIEEQRNRMGRFLLIGSLKSPLIKALHGYVAHCELSPLLVREYPEDRWDELWQYGGYPVSHEAGKPAFPIWQHHYLEQMAQRDLPNWGFSVMPMVTQRLFHMLAAINGQAWNASQIGKSLGVSYHTVNTYVDFLERAFLVRRLPACKLETKKRLVKTSKLYWKDTGLLHALMNLDPLSDFWAQPWIGNSWEGWVIEQILNHLHACGSAFTASHFGTSDQYGLDLLLEYKKQRWAINISLSSIPEIHMMERLQASADLVDASRILLICRTPEPIEHDRAVALDVGGALNMLLD